MPTVDGVLKAARSQLGLGEPNFIQRWYRERNGSAYSGNFAWCDAFVSWCWWKAGGTKAGMPDFAYTVYHAQWFSKKGLWKYGTAGIRPGDIVFFDYSGSRSIGAIDHVEIVEKVSDGVVYTIGGNVSNMCKRMRRTKGTIVGYGRPPYSSKPEPPKKEIKPFTTSRWPYKEGVNIKKGWKDSCGVATVQSKLNALQYKPALVVDGEYGDRTDEAVRAFQKTIGYKPWSGVGKYTYNKLWTLSSVTWPAPSTSMKGAYGLDYAWSHPSVSAMKSKNVRFAVRYLSYDTKGKTLTKKELKELHDGGIKVGLVWETKAARAGAGYTAGQMDAREALRQSNALGFPANRPIYFAVDYDTAGPATKEYFRGIATVLPLSRIGAYGGYRPIKWLHENKLISWCWQTYAWSSGMWYGKNHIEQYKNEVTFDRADVDFNRGKQDDIGVY